MIDSIRQSGNQATHYNPARAILKVVIFGAPLGVGGLSGSCMHPLYSTTGRLIIVKNGNCMSTRSMHATLKLMFLIGLIARLIEDLSIGSVHLIVSLIGAKPHAYD